MNILKKRNITLPYNSMVGTFIKKIKHEQISDLFDLIPLLEDCAKVVNLVKHSLIGMGMDKKVLHLWDMQTRQTVFISEEQRNTNIKIIQQAIQMAKEKSRQLRKG